MKLINEINIVCGGAGFIGHHLARKLKEMGKYVIAVDRKSKEEAEEFSATQSYCDHYIQADLSTEDGWKNIEIHCGVDLIRNKTTMYQLACEMGGAGYVFTGDNDYNIMTTSVLINIYAIRYACKWGAKIFYSSSACMYPAYNQTDPTNPKCSEDSAYPAQPDSEYGWEKLFSERLYLTAARNRNLEVRIARFHNIFGPEGTYDGGKEKAPAALCRKVIQATDSIEVWGDGTQTRSFLYIDECVEAVLKLMESSHSQPINIGSEEMVTINALAMLAISYSNKDIKIKNIPGPIGVMGRNSDNTIMRSVLGWEPTLPLADGIAITYAWIEKELSKKV